MMVRRHVTATLCIIGSKLLEHVFSTSFLHCAHILIEFCMSDCSTSEASENVIPEVHTLSYSYISSRSALYLLQNKYIDLYFSLTYVLV